MRITLLQTDIVWENKQVNMLRLRERLEALSGKTKIVVLPETFSTGFSMASEQLAEPVSGDTIATLLRWASELDLALAGSYISCNEQRTVFYNRAFFLTPEGRAYFCDKRHLFRMGRESLYFTAGNERRIITYRGWNILLQVCYDLRFPVWSRNVDGEYDLLIYVANWPSSRRRVWDVLLQARALENMVYVCGVNRIGTDGEGLAHNGGSVIYSPKGDLLASVPDDIEGVATADISLSDLQTFRAKFPAWRDADEFRLFR
ncbi:MAG: amidohydrolase [Mediterranea sp.]|jgi:predicted amidohydrolase|nr:amidohydrolase [Mediterranea sp.]